MILKRKKELLEDGTKLSQYKIFTSKVNGGGGLAGGALAGGGGAGFVAMDIAAVSTIGAAAGGAIVGCAIIGGIAYGASKKFGWYEIDC